MVNVSRPGLPCRGQVFEYLELDYNRQRRHSAIGMINLRPSRRE